MEPLGNDVASIERQIYRLIRRALMSGAFLPGGRLSSRSLATALGVSATPVREALKRLEGDGVLKSRAKSAYFVPGLSRREYQQILVVRMSLEGFAAGEAAAKITRSQLDHVRALNKTLQDSQTGAEFVRANFDFHFAIYEAARAPYALGLIENAWLRIGPTISMIYGQLPPVQGDDAHARIILALDAGDAKGAEAAVQDDLRNAGAAVSLRLQP